MNFAQHTFQQVMRNDLLLLSPSRALQELGDEIPELVLMLEYIGVKGCRQEAGNDPLTAYLKLVCPPYAHLEVRPTTLVYWEGPSTDDHVIALPVGAMLFITMFLRGDYPQLERY